MRVAIIGAGVSGLACAIELEKNGIEPDIFEEKYMIGELFDHCAALLEVITKPVGDPLEYLKTDFGLNIKSMQMVNSIHMHGCNVNREIKRNHLGYFFIRGQSGDSVENQLYRKLNTKVKFDTAADYRDLMDDYDYVVIATGNNSVSKSVGCWQDLVDTWVYGSEVIGTFDPSALHMWMDTRYSKSGYAYLAPFDSRRATLALVIPYISGEEMDYYWEKFWEIANLPYSVVKTFKLDHVSGYVMPMIYKNLLFIGSAAGGIEPFLGFGQYFALISGTLAARAIYKGENYENSMKQYRDKNMEMLEFRKALDSLSNEEIDIIIRGLSTPFVRKLIYSSDFNIVKYGSLFVKELFSRFRVDYRR